MALDKEAQIHQIGAEDTGVVERGVDKTKEVEGIWEIMVGEEEDQVADNKQNWDDPALH